jgi:hypothetical protein
MLRALLLLVKRNFFRFVEKRERKKSLAGWKEKKSGPSQNTTITKIQGKRKAACSELQASKSL